MPTKLTKPITREVDVALRAAGYRDGFVVRVLPEGVQLKPRKARWTSALLATWGDIFGVAAERKIQEAQRERAAKRAARKAGVR